MKKLDAELAALNAAVEAAFKARKEWMDAHMADYAICKIGEELVDLNTGRNFGKVAEFYRYHANDQEYDTSMAIHYRFESGDNTSSRPGISFGTHEQYLERRQSEIEYLKRRSGAT